MNVATQDSFAVDLGAGLQMRTATIDDADAIVDFNTRVFDHRVTAWTSDLLSKRHPTVQPDDFTIVEDTRTGAIVSSMCLISQHWAYSGIPLKVGRFELIGTDPEYRRRGLIRKQFELAHARSERKGELLHVITGVDWFYRQFGYELGPRLWGSRSIVDVDLRDLPDGGVDACQLRPATALDIAFIRHVYDQSSRRHIYSALRSEAEWIWEITGRSTASTRRREWMILERAGAPLGYVQYLPCLASPAWPLFRIYQIELKSGTGYLSVARSLLKGLWAKGQALWADGTLACPELRGLELALERDHPFYRVVPAGLLREVRTSPWYLRVPDLVAFLDRVRPALERHLVGSLADGYSGSLSVNCFRDGLRMTFDRGRILAIDRWIPRDLSDGDVQLPASGFVHIVCGWQRLSELADQFPECRATHDASILLDSLFPTFRGKVWVLS